MDDRDTFAAAALTGLLSRPQWMPSECVSEAYRMADAMLRERVTEPMPKEKLAEVSDWITLTDEEREAITRAHDLFVMRMDEATASVLRRLLERIA